MLEPRERVCWLEMSFSSSPLRGANNAPPNSLAGYKEPLRGGGREGK